MQEWVTLHSGHTGEGFSKTGGPQVPFSKSSIFILKSHEHNQSVVEGGFVFHLNPLLLFSLKRKKNNIYSQNSSWGTSSEVSYRTEQGKHCSVCWLIPKTFHSEESQRIKFSSLKEKWGLAPPGCSSSTQSLRGWMRDIWARAGTARGRWTGPKEPGCTETRRGNTMGLLYGPTVTWYWHWGKFCTITGALHIHD